MARHSKWANIKHRKSATDAKKGKVFTKMAKLITVAAQSGGDMETNALLRAAVEKAKASNLPAVNIERAIKKGTGELKGEMRLVEITYEGYGPGGVAIMAKCLTENTNRSFANLRNIMTKNDGVWGSSGCVSWMFERKGIIEACLIIENRDDFELQLIDTGAETIEWDGDFVRLTCPPDSFEQCLKVFNKGVVQKSEVELVPKEEKIINELSSARAISSLIDLIEEDDDVVDVVTNAGYSEGVLDALGNG